MADNTQDVQDKVGGSFEKSSAQSAQEGATAAFQAEFEQASRQQSSSGRDSQGSAEASRREQAPAGENSANGVSIEGNNSSNSAKAGADNSPTQKGMPSGDSSPSTSGGGNSGKAERHESMKTSPEQGSSAHEQAHMDSVKPSAAGEPGATGAPGPESAQQSKADQGGQLEKLTQEKPQEGASTEKEALKDPNGNKSEKSTGISEKDTTNSISKKEAGVGKEADDKKTEPKDLGPDAGAKEGAKGGSAKDAFNKDNDDIAKNKAEARKAESAKDGAALKKSVEKSNTKIEKLPQSGGGKSVPAYNLPTVILDF